jgi:hypothetical protein
VKMKSGVSAVVCREIRQQGRFIAFLLHESPTRQLKALEYWGTLLT